MWTAIAVGIVAFLFSSFVEYWVHRFMHKWAKFGERHRDHHRRNEGQGVLREFFDYVKGAFIAMILPFLISVEVGTGWFVGALIYAAFSAYAHQLQHENARKCFWMSMPVHYAHHKHQMWDHNFGLGVDWWDYIFGTYKKVECFTEEELEQPQGSYLQLRWW
ncbi:MAG: sterol desaturase family protein [Cyanobacteria bacterium SID2]|nr:sterol desaturase family protein [Cyanobacteria bacterium SID2]MBP0004745.1 sterol desaturase family protein [Cyanobacteria bacterium SBC]